MFEEILFQSCFISFQEALYDDSAFSEREFDMRQRALSGTRMGQFMQNQAQRCANISCCLELAKCGEQVSKNLIQYNKP